MCAKASRRYMPTMGVDGAVYSNCIMWVYKYLSVGGEG